MTDTNDPYDLSRFVQAQDPMFQTVLQELASGHKQTHWMWFVFPQLRALGRSAIAQHYGIGSLREAEHYAEHPVLGARLTQACLRLDALEGRTAEQVFGWPDTLKFASSLTLFERARPSFTLFARLIDRYFDGQRDPLTTRWLDEH